MGSPDTDPDARGNEKPAHLVEITQPFYLGKYPVTQGQWEAVMGENPSRFVGHPNRPVESVSWEHVAAFIAKLNEREGENTYGLPTEAQWEYACRAGTEGGRYHEDIGAIVWFGKNSNRETHDVGQKLPNAWGLYDMLGQVWEWVGDWYDHYSRDSQRDPRGPELGSGRVVRGGSWLDAVFCRSVCRYAYGLAYHANALGFRLARRV